MSEVKRYDSRIGNSMGLSVPCSEMYANPTGQFVTYSDYQKLVAENAALKDSVEHAAGCIFAAEAEGLVDALSETSDKRLADLIHRRLCHAYLEVKTPDTDAAIAEIKAQGVELLRDSIPGIETSIEDTRDLNHYCNDFAANLRAGSKG